MGEWKRGIMPYIIIILEDVKYITVVKLICLLNESTKESVLCWGLFFSAINWVLWTNGLLFSASYT